MSVTDVLAGLGVVCVVAGLAMIYVPAGVIAAGVALVVTAVMRAMHEPNR